MSNEIIRLQNLLTKLNNLFSIKIDTKNLKNPLYFRLFFKPNIGITGIDSKAHITLLEIRKNYLHESNNLLDEKYQEICEEIKNIFEDNYLNVTTRDDYEKKLGIFTVYQFNLDNKDKYSEIIKKIQLFIKQKIGNDSDWKRINVNFKVSNGKLKYESGEGLFLNDKILFFISDYYLNGDKWIPHISTSDDNIEKISEKIQNYIKLRKLKYLTLNYIGNFPKNTCRV